MSRFADLFKGGKARRRLFGRHTGPNHLLLSLDLHRVRGPVFVSEAPVVQSPKSRCASAIESTATLLASPTHLNLLLRRFLKVELGTTFRSIPSSSSSCRSAARVRLFFVRWSDSTCSTARFSTAIAPVPLTDRKLAPGVDVPEKRLLFWRPLPLLRRCRASCRTPSSCIATRRASHALPSFA